MADDRLVHRAVDHGDHHGVDDDGQRLCRQTLEQIGPQQHVEGRRVAHHDNAVEGAADEAEEEAVEDAHHGHGGNHLPGVPGLGQAAAEDVLGAHAAEDAHGQGAQNQRREPRAVALDDGAQDVGHHSHHCAAQGTQPHAGQDDGDALEADPQGIRLDTEKAGQNDLDGDERGHHDQVAGGKGVVQSFLVLGTLHFASPP